MRGSSLTRWFKSPINLRLKLFWIAVADDPFVPGRQAMEASTATQETREGRLAGPLASKERRILAPYNP